MWVFDTRRVVDAFDTWNAGAWVIAALMVYGVWRLWRGMRPDAFQHHLRALRERRQRAISFPAQRQAAPARFRLLQISLLPLMLVSCALAMLLAQAQRPDEVSRPVTWALFVGAGVWYGTAAWRRHRGVGPLRNYAFAGVASGVAVSALLWGFYLVVDMWSGARVVGRLTASFPVLLWWTALGGVAGGLVGAFRANRVYSQARADGSAPDSPLPEAADIDLSVKSSPRLRKIPWGAITIACCASALFHLSAAPHLYREVHVRYWTWQWDWDRYHRPGNEIIVTMGTSDSVSDWHADSFRPSHFGDVQVDDSQTLDVDFVIGDSYAPGSIGRTVAAAKRDIAVGQRITGDMLTVTSYPLEGGSDWAVDPKSLIGKYASQRLPAGRPIAAAQVSDRLAQQPRQLGRLGLAAGQPDASVGSGASSPPEPATERAVHDAELYELSYRMATRAGFGAIEDGSDPSNVDVLTGPTPPVPESSSYDPTYLLGGAPPPGSTLLVAVVTADGRLLTGYVAGTTMDALLAYDVLTLQTTTEMVAIQRNKIVSISAESVTVLTKDGKVLTGFLSRLSVVQGASGRLSLRTADGEVTLPLTEIESLKTVQGEALLLPSPVFPSGQGTADADAPSDNSDSRPTEPNPQVQLEGFSRQGRQAAAADATPAPAAGVPATTRQ